MILAIQNDRSKKNKCTTVSLVVNFTLLIIIVSFEVVQSSFAMKMTIFSVYISLISFLET